MQKSSIDLLLQSSNKAIPILKYTKKPLKLSKLHVRLDDRPKPSKSEAQIDRC